MDLGLKGRRALVMGGTKGLGRSIADALAAEGASLVISGRDQGRLDEAAAALKAAGAAAAKGVVADVASSADMDKLADAALAAMGGVDILVLNHGGPPPCTASPDHRAGAAGVVPAHRRLADPHHKPAAAGDAGARLGPDHRGRQHRHAAPDPDAGAVQHPARLDLGLAEDAVGRGGQGRRDDERPGAGDHPDRPGHPDHHGARRKQMNVSFDEALAKAAEEIPAGRLGTPDDYGPMGAFLASEKGAYITGSMIRVDGGRVRGMV